MIILYALVFITILAVYVYQTKNHGFWKNRGIPCAKRIHWFFGHYKEIFMSTQHMGEKFKDMYNEFPEAKCIGYFKLGTPGLLVKDPDIIKEILQTDFTSFARNDLAGIDKKKDFLFGYNPFVLYGEEWKTSRAHATPMTTTVKLKTYFPNILEVAHNMTEYVRNEFGSQGSADLETKELCGMYTTDVVSNAILGISNNTFVDSNSLFASMTREILTGTFIDNTKILITLLFPTLSPYLGIRFASKRTEEILMSLVRKIMKERTETGVTRNDIFQQMITYRKNDPTGEITDEYIASHCFSFIADGYETSSDVICFTLFEIAWNFDVQNKLRKEIQDMMAKNNGQYSIEDVENNKYLHMVVSESLRLHPPALLMSKLCTEDCTLTVNNKGDTLRIPKDTPVSIPVFGLHMDPKHFPTPDKFDPERFSDENLELRHKYVYLPFGEGPRKCLGQRFALLQVKIAIITLINKFHLKPSIKSQYPLQIDPKVLVKRPLNGAWVSFTELLSI